MSARVALRRIRSLRNPGRAKVLQSFFKTGPGQYGEGDRFLGLTVPQIRQLAAEIGPMDLAELERLLESEWHEARLLALVVAGRMYAQGTAEDQASIYHLYLRRADRINNWDLVDTSAPGIVGAHLLGRSRRVLRRLARSTHLWERRIAIIATQHFIRHGEFDDTLELAELLLRDRHDLIHKAVGWMLREVGNRDVVCLRRFLTGHAADMPRTALRYAIERLPPAERRRFLAMRRR